MSLLSFEFKIVVYQIFYLRYRKYNLNLFFTIIGCTIWTHLHVMTNHLYTYSYHPRQFPIRYFNRSSRQYYYCYYDNRYDARAWITHRLCSSVENSNRLRPCAHLAGHRHISASRPWTRAWAVCTGTGSHCWPRRRRKMVFLCSRSTMNRPCPSPWLLRRRLHRRCHRLVTPYRCSHRRKFPSNISHLLDKQR